MRRVLAILALSSCAWWAKIDPPNKAHMTPDCTGVDEQTCDPNRASASFCCDQHAGWNCNPWATPPRCEYTGESDPNMPVPFCGPLGCGAAPDGGRDAGH